MRSVSAMHGRTVDGLNQWQWTVTPRSNSPNVNPDELSVEAVGGWVARDYCL